MPATTANIAEILDRRKISTFQAGVIALSTAVVFVEGLNVQAAGYIAPALEQSFRLTRSDLTVFFTAGTVGLMLGALLVAPLADRIGRRPVLVGCVFLFGLASLLTAIGPSLEALEVFRFLTGLGIGGGMPNAIAITAEYSPENRRSAMVAIMMTGFILGSIAAGLIGAWLVPSYGWQSVFVVGGSVSLLLAPMLFVRLPESLRFLVLQGRERALIVRHLQRIDPALMVAEETRFVVDEHTGSGDSVTALFNEGRVRTTLLLWTIYFMSLLNLYLLASWVTTHVHSLGIAVQLSILIGTMFQVGGVFGAMFGWLVDRMGPSRAIFIAYLIGALAIAAIPLAGADPVALTLAVFASGFGIIGGQNAANALAAMSYPTQIRSTGVGWATGIGRFGSVVGPGVAGILLSLNFSTQHVFYLAVIPALIASAAGVALGDWRRPVAADTNAPA
ncbi:MAG TPA: MFS transporter [Micropepsaceae bacterium]|nr:MFS transporter [Micropepsaceae bacterium]